MAESATASCQSEEHPYVPYVPPAIPIKRSISDEGGLSRQGSQPHHVLLRTDVTAARPIVEAQGSFVFSSSFVLSNPGTPRLGLSSKKSYEILMLCRLLMGPVVELVTLGALSLYQVGSLWSYISVFASSMSAIVPLPSLNSGGVCDIYLDESSACIELYHTWLLIFCAAMVVLCALETEEQVAFQVGMTLARVAVIGLMLWTMLFGTREQFQLPALADDAEDSWPALFVPSGLTTVVPVAVFCQLFQVGVPSLLQPLQDKFAFRAVFGWALTTTLVLYALLGLIAALFFGPLIDPSCNLNWATYSPRSVALIIALFPALDCFSVFPMNALFLANNVMAVVYGKEWHSRSISRTAKFGFRLLCCAPPFACAYLFPSLSHALNFTGIVGIVLPYVITPLLHRASLRECHAHWGQEKFDAAERRAKYSTVFSTPRAVAIFGVFGSLLLGFTITCGLLYGF